MVYVFSYLLVITVLNQGSSYSESSSSSIMSITRHLALLLSKQSCTVFGSAAPVFMRSGPATTSQLRNLPRAIASVNHQNEGYRSFHTTGIRCDSALAKLRKKTGLVFVIIFRLIFTLLLSFIYRYAFSLCRKALELNDQDLAKAEKWLRAEALKQGWEKAERVKVCLVLANLPLISFSFYSLEIPAKDWLAFLPHQIEPKPQW